MARSATTVDWESATAFLTGSEPVENDEEQDTNQETAEDDTETPENEEDEPELVEFSYKGRKLRVTPEDAEALEDLRRQARGANGRLGSENANLRERLARLEGQIASRGNERPAVDDGPKKPDPELALTNFPEWQRQYDAYEEAQRVRIVKVIQEEINTGRSKAQEEAEKAARGRRWADTFYSEYPHLRSKARMATVAQVYAENREELDGYGDDFDTAFPRLAELAEERIAEIAGGSSTRRGKANKNQRPPTPASSRPATPRGTREEVELDRPRGGAAWQRKERARLRGES